PRANLCPTVTFASRTSARPPTATFLPSTTLFRSGGKGLLAAVELVEDRATKKNFAADRKVAARIQAEMMKRGVVTRTRAVVGPHPAPGDAIYFAPPLIVTEAEIERIVDVARDAVQAAVGA